MAVNALSTQTKTQTHFGLSARARRTGDQPISELMQIALENPGLISLAAGFVDFQTLPVEQMRELSQAVLADTAEAQSVLQYGTTRGLPELRQAVVELVAQTDGFCADDVLNNQYPATADDVIVTAGSQQSLHILADLLLDPGDIIITGWPSYFVFTGALDTFGAKVRSVALDQQGMCPEKLDALLGELQAKHQLTSVKAVYVIPEFQNPTGLSLAEERRAELLAVVQKYSIDHHILLIEDSAYRQLGEPGLQLPATIKSFDTDNRYVAHLGTFSKPFSPGLKTGFAILPRDLVEQAVLNKGGRDFGSPNFNQAILAKALTSGLYAKHVAKLQAAYAVKRDACLSALEKSFAGVEGVSWTKPDGGLYIWLTLPETIDTGKQGQLFHQAVEAGVLYVPGAYCFPNDSEQTPPVNTIRLSFGVADEQAIALGVSRLAQAVKQVLARSGGAV